MLTTKSSAAKPAETALVNAMSVDVEDYYQVWALSSVIRRSDWPSYESRVAASTGRVLSMFAAAGVKATFFTWHSPFGTPPVRLLTKLPSFNPVCAPNRGSRAVFDLAERVMSAILLQTAKISTR